MSPADTPEENRCPACQVPVPAIWASWSALLPRPEEAEVAKGITVLPVKSLPFKNVFTGHAAEPHQMGYPMNTTS